MSEPMTSKDTSKSISSQGLAGGALHSFKRCGRTIDLFGQEVAPASPLAQRGSKKARQMNAISGQCGFGSLPSVSLQSFLENKLQHLLPTAGGMMWQMIWKAKATPAGRRYFQLAVSASPTKEIGSGLWPTPRSQEPGATTEGYGRGLQELVEGKTQKPAQKKPTMWATPDCSDRRSIRSKQQGLSNQVKESICLIPMAQNLHMMERMPFNGLPIQTEKPAQLSLEFPCWLMGYSTAHLSSMRLAMQSYRKSQRNLLKR